LKRGLVRTSPSEANDIKLVIDKPNCLNELKGYDDQTLVRYLKTGDRASFTEIYDRYWEKLYFLAYSHLKSEAATEEIVQEIFLTLWKKRDRLQIELLSPYLAAMTRYAVYKKLQRDRKKEQVEAKAAPGLAVPGDELKAVDDRNLLDLIGKLSNVLPEKCRLVFIHNKLLDKSIDEVAAILKISTKTAEAHLTKALKIVRARLEDMA
jgi:RNA polymerase sigma-70 factor (ECF subfamily)